MAERYTEEALRLREEKLRKCAVVGVGRVGSSVAHALIQMGRFSEMVLLDADERKAAGEASDLAHALPLGSPTAVYAGDYADLSDCGLIVLAAGASPRGVPTPAELLRVNAAVVTALARRIACHNREAILINATDSVDLMSYLLYRASDFPACRVIGTGTVADTAHMRRLLCNHLGVDKDGVNAFILGEQGENELVVWSSANVAGVDLRRYCESCGRGYEKSILDGIFREVREEARRAAGSKGSSCFAVAEAVKSIATAILQDDNAILPVSTLVDGHYGLEGVYMSLPCVLNRSGIRRVLEIPLSEEEELFLMRSARRLSQTLRTLREETSPALF